MTPADIYTILFTGVPVSVPVENRKMYESLRTSLHRHHKLMVEIGGSELSVVATFNTVPHPHGVFKLGVKRGNHNYAVELCPESTLNSGGG